MDDQWIEQNRLEHRELFGKLDQLVFSTVEVSAAVKQLVAWQHKHNGVEPRLRVLEARWKVAGWITATGLTIATVSIAMLRLLTGW